MSVVRSDNFNRADGAIGTPSDGGSDWQSLTAIANWVVASNVANETTGGSQVVVVLESGNVDVTLQVTMGGTVFDAGICWRATDENAYYLMNGTASNIYRNIGGSFGLITTSGGGVAVGAGDVVQAVISGNNFTINVNGSFRTAASDGFYPSQTLHGLRQFISAAATWDDFSITIVDPPAASSGEEYTIITS